MGKHIKTCLPASKATTTPDADYLQAKAELEAFHTCQGVKRRGLTYDPGAAGGLTGTDTLLDYDAGKPPHFEDREVVDSHQTFSGISGESSPSLGEVRQTQQLGRLTIKYCGDLIGGSGSFCPMLLGLPPMIDHRAIVLHGIFGNSDGAMVLFPVEQQKEDKIDETSNVYVYRLLHTDSGHYLLPTDDLEGQCKQEKALAVYQPIGSDFFWTQRAPAVVAPTVQKMLGTSVLG